MNDKRRRHRNTGTNIDTGLHADINNNPPVTYIGRHNWRHLGHNQDTRLTLTELIMTGKHEGPYKGEETKAEEDKLWHYPPPPLPIGASRAVWHRKGRGGGRSGGLKVLGDRTGGLQGGARSGTHGGSGDSGGHGGSGDSGGHGGAGCSGCLHGGAGSLRCLRGRAGSLGGHGG